MHLKTKLTLGLVLLFGLLVLVSILGILNINALSTDANAILKDNYKTLEFVQRMQNALDYLAVDPSNRETFATNLHYQQQNITEPGEGEATDGLARAFERLEKNPADSLAEADARRYLSQITEVNLQAMGKKNEQAQQTAEQTATLLGIIATFCIVIGFTFLLNFPGYIAKPIRQLTEGIQEIARGNYDQRIHLDRHDEFGELSAAFNDLAAKLDAYENSNLARILFEKKRLETVISALHDPIIGFDENYQILFANAPALTLLHLSAAKLLGKDAREVALTNDLLRTLLARRAQPQTEPLKIFADGKESFFQLETLDISVQTAGDVPSQGIGQVLLLKNITPFRELDVAKTNFIATISHELKTPISSIKMGLSLLDDQRVGTLNTEQRDLLRQLGDDANRLLGITSELLKIAQAETGNIQLNLTPTPPLQLIETARQALAGQAREKNIRMEVAPMADTGQLVLADADKTIWVLVNLLSNAIRYSPENQSVQIQVTREHGQFRFSVQDHGPGISPAYQEKIFERFFRVPGAVSQGTGLGLAISREFVWAMGGEIGVQSRVGEGSVFWFTLREA